MRDWPEFVRGEEYSVELAADDERVFITMVERSEDDSAHVLVRGELGGRLFLLALGGVAYELAAHSDDLSVMRWEGPDAIESDTPRRG
jgi:hypothetical protein